MLSDFWFVKLDHQVRLIAFQLSSPDSIIDLPIPKENTVCIYIPVFKPIFFSKAEQLKCVPENIIPQDPGKKYNL